MKRAIIFVCVLTMICTALCGCGDMRGDQPVQTPVATMDLVPETSPVLTPDVNDGIVKDQDGVIEDNEPTGTAVPSASPRPSAGPAVTVKP